MANKIQFEHKRKFDKMMRKLNKTEYKTCDKCSYDILDDDGDVMEHICTPLVYSATIQWHDNKEIRDHMFIKIGDIEDDDDDIFFYMESEEELKEAYKDDFHEWKILECEQIEY